VDCIRTSVAGEAYGIETRFTPEVKRGVGLSWERALAGALTVANLVGTRLRAPRMVLEASIVYICVYVCETG
jgi:hypothetical protein